MKKENENISKMKEILRVALLSTCLLTTTAMPSIYSYADNGADVEDAEEDQLNFIYANDISDENKKALESWFSDYSKRQNRNDLMYSIDKNSPIVIYKGGGDKENYIVYHKTDKNNFATELQIQPSNGNSFEFQYGTTEFNLNSYKGHVQAAQVHQDKKAKSGLIGGSTTAAPTTATAVSTPDHSTVRRLEFAIPQGSSEEEKKRAAQADVDSTALSVVNRYPQSTMADDLHKSPSAKNWRDGAKRLDIVVDMNRGASGQEGTDVKGLFGGHSALDYVVRESKKQSGQNYPSGIIGGSDTVAPTTETSRGSESQSKASSTKSQSKTSKKSNVEMVRKTSKKPANMVKAPKSRKVVEDDAIDFANNELHS